MTWQQLIDLLQRMIPDQLNQPMAIEINHMYAITDVNVIVNNPEEDIVPYLILNVEVLHD